MNTMQSNWFKSDDISELAGALANFQSDAPDIKRTKTVKVKTRNGSYKFSYAPLDEVFDAVREPLADEGLSVTQLVGDRVSVTTMLMHESGQYIGATFEFKDNISYDEDESSPFKDMQDVGSAVTYAKRYGLEAILGVVAQDDDDGNKASGNSISSKSSSSKFKDKSKSKKKGKSKSNNKKSSESKSESKDTDDFEIPDEPDSDWIVDTFDNQSKAVKWYQNQMNSMDEEDAQEFKDNWQPAFQEAFQKF